MQRDEWRRDARWCIALMMIVFASACDDSASAPRAPTAPVPASTTAASTGVSTGVVQSWSSPTQTLSTADSDPKLIEVAGLRMPKPPSWQWQVPIAQFRTLQYSVPTRGASAGDAELTISVFNEGDGGSIDLNVQRWKSQFMSDDGSPAPATSADRTVDGIPIKLVELAGFYQGVGQAAPRPDIMLLGAIVQHAGRTLYIRVIGQTATVEASRARFDAMVNGLRRAE